MPREASATCSSAAIAPRSRVFCQNRSPQVTPVRLSSGNTSTFTPSASAFFMTSMICSALYMGSATRSIGAAAATFRNPSFILTSLFSYQDLAQGTDYFSLNVSKLESKYRSTAARVVT